MDHFGAVFFLSVPNEETRLPSDIFALYDSLKEALNHGARTPEVQKVSLCLVDALNKRGIEHCNLGDFSTAESHLNQADSYTQPSSSHLYHDDKIRLKLRAVSLNNMACMEHKRNQGNAAFLLLQQALYIEETMNESPSTILANLSSVETTTSRYDSAIVHSRRAIKILNSRSFTPEIINIIIPCWINLFVSQQQSFDPKERAAGPQSHERALQLCSEYLGPSHTTTIRLREMLRTTKAPTPPLTDRPHSHPTKTRTGKSQSARNMTTPPAPAVERRKKDSAEVVKRRSALASSAAQQALQQMWHRKEGVSKAPPPLLPAEFMASSKPSTQEVALPISNIVPRYSSVSPDTVSQRAPFAPAAVTGADQRATEAEHVNAITPWEIPPSLMPQSDPSQFSSAANFQMFAAPAPTHVPRAPSATPQPRSRPSSGGVGRPSSQPEKPEMKPAVKPETKTELKRAVEETTTIATTTTTSTTLTFPGDFLQLLLVSATRTLQFLPLLKVAMEKGIYHEGFQSSELPKPDAATEVIPSPQKQARLLGEGEALRTILNVGLNDKGVVNNITIIAKTLGLSPKVKDDPSRTKMVDYSDNLGIRFHGIFMSNILNVFELEFRYAVAELLKVHYSDVEISTIRPGSVIVDFKVKNLATDTLHRVFKDAQDDGSLESVFKKQLTNEFTKLELIIEGLARTGSLSFADVYTEAVGEPLARPSPVIPKNVNRSRILELHYDDVEQEVPILTFSELKKELQLSALLTNNLHEKGAPTTQEAVKSPETTTTTLTIRDRHRMKFKERMKLRERNMQMEKQQETWRKLEIAQMADNKRSNEMYSIQQMKIKNQKRYAAAIKIQKAYRGYHARVNVIQRKKKLAEMEQKFRSARAIQRVARRWLQRSAEARALLRHLGATSQARVGRVYDAVCTLQRFWRCCMARKEVEKRITLLRKGWTEKLHRERKRQAATQIQALVRGNCGRLKTSMIASFMRNRAAKIIQREWRRARKGFISARATKHREIKEIWASCKIQACWRGYLTRLWFACTKLKLKIQAIRTKEIRAATKIQKTVRGHIARKAFKPFRELRKAEIAKKVQGQIKAREQKYEKFLIESHANEVRDEAAAADERQEKLKLFEKLVAYERQLYLEIVDKEGEAIREAAKPDKFSDYTLARTAELREREEEIERERVQKVMDHHFAERAKAKKDAIIQPVTETGDEWLRNPVQEPPLVPSQVVDTSHRGIPPLPPDEEDETERRNAPKHTTGNRKWWSSNVPETSKTVDDLIERSLPPFEHEPPTQEEQELINANIQLREELNKVLDEHAFTQEEIDVFRWNGT